MTKQRLACVAAGLGCVAAAALLYLTLGTDAGALAALLGTGGTALALTVPPTLPARGDVDQRLHYIRVRVVVANVAAFAAGKKIARLPSRAFLHSVKLHKSVAFNSATTDTLQLGSTAAGVDILAATDVKTAAGYVDLTAAAGLGVFNNGVGAAGETDLFCRYLQSGAVATLGDATLTIAYIPDADQ